jgi:chromosome segregation ATPase
VQHAGAWSETTAKRLESLLGSIESRSQEFGQAGNILLRANDALKETLQRNQAALDALSRAGEQVKMYSTSLAGLAKTAEDTQKSQVQAAKLAVQLIEEFRRVSEANAGFLNEYKGIFSAYKGVFDGLDTKIAATLTAINQGMNEYTQTVENNFRSIVSVTNEHLPQISATLKEQITELEGQLEELSDVLDRGLKALRT